MQKVVRGGVIAIILALALKSALAVVAVASRTLDIFEQLVKGWYKIPGISFASASFTSETWPITPPIGSSRSLSRFTTWSQARAADGRRGQLDNAGERDRRKRFIRTVRSECLDWPLILNARHLEPVLTVSSIITFPSGSPRLKPRAAERSVGEYQSGPPPVEAGRDSPGPARRIASRISACRAKATRWLTPCISSCLPSTSTSASAQRDRLGPEGYARRGGMRFRPRFCRSGRAGSQGLREGPQRRDRRVRSIHAKWSADTRRSFRPRMAL